jgi:hypothetical protein
MTDKIKKSDIPILTAQRPVIGHRYWVQCDEFRCMAVADYNGKWKLFANGKQLSAKVISFWQP